MKNVYPRALRLVEQGLVDAGAVVSGHLPLDQAASAFTCAVTRHGLKVMVDPSKT